MTHQFSLRHDRHSHAVSRADPNLEQRTLGPETDGTRAWSGFAVATAATELVTSSRS